MSFDKHVQSVLKTTSCYYAYTRSLNALTQMWLPSLTVYKFRAKTSRKIRKLILFAYDRLFSNNDEREIGKRRRLFKWNIIGVKSRMVNIHWINSSIVKINSIKYGFDFINLNHKGKNEILRVLAGKSKWIRVHFGIKFDKNNEIYKLNRLLKHLLPLAKFRKTKFAFCSSVRKTSEYKLCVSFHLLFLIQIPIPTAALYWRTALKITWEVDPNMSIREKDRILNKLCNKWMITSEILRCEFDFPIETY